MRAATFLTAFAWLAVACGPPDQAAFVAIAAAVDGRNDMTLEASAMVIDAAGSPAWLGSHAARLSASAAPDDLPPLNVCLVQDGDGRPGSLSTFRLLELGAVRFGGPGGETPLDPTPPLAGEGTGYRVSAAAEPGDFQAGGSYTLQADGIEGPSLSAQVTAPPEFQVDSIGFTTPGPGTVIIPVVADLTLRWAPAADDELFLILSAAAKSIVCRVSDSGEFTIKKKLLEKVPIGDGTLVIERVRDERFDTGFATDQRQWPGYIRFAYRRHYVVDLQ